MMLPISERGHISAPAFPQTLLSPYDEISTLIKVAKGHFCCLQPRVLNCILLKESKQHTEDG